jgi:hypothetical protein
MAAAPADVNKNIVTSQPTRIGLPHMRHSGTQRRVNHVGLDGTDHFRDRERRDQYSG